jgi:hypothetical protein
MVSCSFCGKEFETVKGVSVHYRHSQHCLTEYRKRKEFEKDNDKRTKVECLVCGQMLRNISNTHLKKHNITQKEYIEKYNAGIFAEGLTKEQSKKREETIARLYGDNDPRKLSSQKSHPRLIEEYGSLSEWARCLRENEPGKYAEAAKKTSAGVRKFYELLRVDADNHAKHKETRTEKRKETNLEKYGVEFCQSLAETKNKQKETLVKNHGSLEKAYRKAAIKGAQTRYNKYGAYCNYFPNFSLESKRFFDTLEGMLLEAFPEIECAHATNGRDNTKSNERQILTSDGTVRYLDFFIEKILYAIEFDEPHHNNKRQQTNDKRRTTMIKKEIPGLIIKRVPMEQADSLLVECFNEISELINIKEAA